MASNPWEGEKGGPVSLGGSVFPAQSRGGTATCRGSKEFLASLKVTSRTCSLSRGVGNVARGSEGGSSDALCIPRNARKSFEDPPPLHLPAYLSVSLSPRERFRSKNFPRIFLSTGAERATRPSGEEKNISFSWNSDALILSSWPS